MQLLGSLALFLVCVAFANVSAWTGALAIARLPSGLDALVVLGTPLTLFLLPGLVLRWLKRRTLRRAAPAQPPTQARAADRPTPKGKEAQPTDKPKKPPTDDGSLLGRAAVGMISFGILCPLSMFFVGPATSAWVDLQSGEVVESATADEALQHPDAVYISLQAAQVHGELVGSSRYRVGRGSYTYYYAVPVVTGTGPIDGPRPAAKAAASRASKTKESYEPKLKPRQSTGQGEAYTLWVGTTDQQQLATINGRSLFGGQLQRFGGDYAEAIDDAIRRHDLGAVEKPFVIELGAPTHQEALEETQLSGWLGLGLFNLLFVALGGLMAFGRGNKSESGTRAQ